MYFCYFVIIFPWKKEGPFIWTNLNSLHPKMIHAKFGWNWPSGSGEEDFLNLAMYFPYFGIISPWKRAEPFICTNLNPLSQKMLCVKFGWNWLSGSGEDDFKISLYFVIISPWKRVENKFAFPSPKDALRQVWLKLAPLNQLQTDS